jgi:hypothetical protein
MGAACRNNYGALRVLSIFIYGTKRLMLERRSMNTKARQKAGLAPQ